MTVEDDEVSVINNPSKHKKCEVRDLLYFTRQEQEGQDMVRGSSGDGLDLINI